MTVRELIEKLEHVTEHRLEQEVCFWFSGGEEVGSCSIEAIEDIGDHIQIRLE